MLGLLTVYKALGVISTQCPFYFTSFCRYSPQSFYPGKIKKNLIMWKSIPTRPFSCCFYKSYFISCCERPNCFKVSIGPNRWRGTLNQARWSSWSRLGWNKSGCLCTEATVWGDCSVSQLSLQSSCWAQTSFLSGTVVMRRISWATRLSSVCLCTDSLMDNLHPPPGDVYVV